MSKPFLKWAGGKWEQAEKLAAKFPKPESYKTYWEPFVGGAAMFFYLRPKRAVLSDSLEPLMLTYRVVRDSPEELSRLLLGHHRGHEARFSCHYHDTVTFFNQVTYRLMQGEQLDDITLRARAAEFIYLNRWCFNGLCRFNRSGAFNVPMGKFKSAPRIYDPERILEASVALQGARIQVGDYRRVLFGRAGVQRGDFVYLDPPYWPLSKTANFSGYTVKPFGIPEHRILADNVRKLDSMGVHVALSNHDVREVRQIYRGFNLTKMQGKRNINSKGEKRGRVAELLIRNF